MSSQPDMPRFDEGTNGRSFTTLSGRWLIVARVMWIAVAILTVGLSGIGVWVYHAWFDPRCGLCTSMWWSPHAVKALREFGFSADLSTTFLATYSSALDLAYTFGFWAMGLLIFWKKSDDWLALFVSLTLIMLGAPMGLLETRGLVDHPAWEVPAAIVFVLGYACFFVLFLIFPDGRFVPRWTRWVAVGWAMFVLYLEFRLLSYPYLYILFPDLFPHPYAGTNLRALFEKFAPPLWWGFIVMIGSAALAQVYRYKRVSGPVERQQAKFFAVAAVVMVSVLLLDCCAFIFVPGEIFGPRSAYLEIWFLIWGGIDRVVLLLVPLSIGFAILRYRLWDIDIIINRTLLYGALTASIVGLYVLIVGGLGSLLQARGNPAVSLLATGLIAVLFVPLRDRLQHGVNRLMYGERDDPYAVLSRLGRRLEATVAPRAVLSTIVETVAQALKLPYAAIALRREDGTFAKAAEHGTPKGEPVVLPLVYQRERIGELILAARAPDEPFGPTDRHLLEDLARQAEVAVHAVRLTDELQRSRERLVTAREEERRRLRRDLHDGLGPMLGGLTLGLDAARALLAQDPKGADALLAALKAQTQEAVSDIRHLVYNLRPPALDDLGLVAAIRQQAANHGLLTDDLSMEAGSKNGLVFSVEAPEQLPTLPAAVEVACYRIAQEAITNAARHAKASSCQVRLLLDAAEQALELEVVDDGIGIPEGRRAGVGMNSMRERAEELGGTFTVGSAPEGGTRVLAHLPLPARGEEE